MDFQILHHPKKMLFSLNLRRRLRRRQSPVLPLDIIEAILRLLPAKSVGQFKCVSKTFNSLISRNTFIKSHLTHHNHTNNNNKLILFSYDNPLVYSVDATHLVHTLNTTNDTITNNNNDDDASLMIPDVPTTMTLVDNTTNPPTTKQAEVLYFNPYFFYGLDEPTPVLPTTPATVLGPTSSYSWCERVYGSHNGLVLAKDGNNKLLMVNPTTREVWKVPKSPFVELEFKARPSFREYGFVYDEAVDDYKIVAMSYWDRWYAGPNDPLPDCTDTLVTVYSVRDNLWTKLPNSPIYEKVSHSTCTAVEMNGCFHWLASDSRIVAFDIASAVEVAAAGDRELYYEIRLPRSIARRKSKFCQLMIIGEKLGLVGVGGDKEVWVMEEYGVVDSWKKLCSLGDKWVGMGGVTVKTLCLESRYIMLSSNDADFDDEYDDDEDDEAVVYDVDEKRCRKVKILGGPRKSIVGGAYVETLESPKRLVTPSLT